VGDPGGDNPQSVCRGTVGDAVRRETHTVDPVVTNQLQFALTTIVHIVFPVTSVVLAPVLVYVA